MGCSVVGLIEYCIRGEGPSIVVLFLQLEESQAEVVACMTVQQRVYCTYPYSSGSVAAQSELDLRIYDAPCMLAGY